MRRTIFHAVVALVMLTQVMPVMAQGGKVPQVANVMGRQTMSLCGEWNYIVDVQEEGYYDYRMNPTPWGFFRNAKPQRPEDLIEYDFDKAPTMNIPGDWNTQDDRLFFYEGTVWFKRSFQYHPTGKCALLYFSAVNYEARVWVNGKAAGYHVGGFTPFNFDVTELLVDGENTVIVKVDNKRHKSDVPTQIFDWWNYGGITRDVMLVEVAPTYIENYKVFITDCDVKKAKLHFSAQLNKAKNRRNKDYGMVPSMGYSAPQGLSEVLCLEHKMKSIDSQIGSLKKAEMEITAKYGKDIKEMGYSLLAQGN